MDVEWCVRTIQRVCSDLAVYADGRSVDLANLDSHSAQLQLVYRELVAAELLGQHVAPALECVREAVRMLENAVDHADSRSSYQAPTLPERGIGRPRFDIPALESP